MRWLTSLVLCLGFTGAAHAQEISGPYLGLALGYFSYEERNEELQVGIRDNTTVYRVVGGYQLNSIYTVEASFARTSDIEQGFRALDPNNEVVTLDIATANEMATVRFLALAPFSGLNMFGGIGYFDMDVETTLDFRSTADNFTLVDEANQSGVTLVGGVQYDWDRISLRGEYEWFDMDGEVETTSINLVALFRF